MDKKIILIVGQPNNKEEGARFEHFTSLYKKYFTSIAGGAFEDDEIVLYNQTTLINIESELRLLKVNYAIVVLIGHGGTNDGKHILQLNNSEIIFPGQLPIIAPKQLYIVESCRNNIECELPIVDLNRVTNFKDGGVFRLSISREKARERFDSELENTDNGITICMSCSKNQSAFDFYFTSTLLTVGHNWHIHTNNFGKCLGINDTITKHVGPHVEKLAKKIDKKQNPQLIGDDIDYPFSVCKF